MSTRRYKHILLSLASGGLFAIGLFLLLDGTSQPGRADAGTTRYAAVAGAGTDCMQVSPCPLRTALAQAQEGDAIYVAQGTYTGTGGAVITVTQSTALYGGWDGSTVSPLVRDPGMYPTILDGEGQRRGVHISGTIAPTIDGFVISGGEAPDGGGVYIHDASPTIRDNVITTNRTITSAYADGRGGGIYVDGGSNAIIVGNHILSNTSGYGGGIYHNGRTAITVTGNTIAENTATYRAGGVMVERAPDIVQANLIARNSAASDGGGMVIWAAAPQVEANRIISNGAPTGGGIGIGNDATPSLLNNAMIGNTRDGLDIISSSPAIVNNTIVGSGLSTAGYGIDLFSSPGCVPPYCTTGRIANNIVISFAIGIYGTGTVTPEIDYNDVWGNATADYVLPVGVAIGAHNISLDPLLSGPADDEYHLPAGSPCIDAGDPTGVPPAPSTDIDGDPRPIGDRVDIGADEYVVRIYLPVVLRSRFTVPMLLYLLILLYHRVERH